MLSVRMKKWKSENHRLSTGGQGGFHINHCMYHSLSRARFMDAPDGWNWQMSVCINYDSQLLCLRTWSSLRITFLLLWTWFFSIRFSVHRKKIQPSRRVMVVLFFLTHGSLLSWSQKSEAIGALHIKTYEQWSIYLREERGNQNI